MVLALVSLRPPSVVAIVSLGAVLIYSKVPRILLLSLLSFCVSADGGFYAPSSPALVLRFP